MLLVSLSAFLCLGAIAQPYRINTPLLISRAAYNLPTHHTFSARQFKNSPPAVGNLRNSFLASWRLGVRRSVVRFRRESTLLRMPAAQIHDEAGVEAPPCQEDLRVQRLLHLHPDEDKQGRGQSKDGRKHRRPTQVPTRKDNAEDHGKLLWKTIAPVMLAERQDVLLPADPDDRVEFLRSSVATGVMMIERIKGEMPAATDTSPCSRRTCGRPRP